MDKDFPKVVFLSKKKGILGIFRVFLLFFILILLFFAGVGVFFIIDNPAKSKNLSAKTESIEKQNSYLSHSIEKLKQNITITDTSYKEYQKLLYSPKKSAKNEVKDLMPIDSLSIRGLVGYSSTLLEFFDEIAQNAPTTKGVWRNLPLVFPFSNDAKLVVMRPFSQSLPDPFTGTKKAHEGIDIAAENGTPILAPADGEVVLAREKDTFWGKVIKIAHTNGYETIYAHLGTISVRQGQKIRRGAIIGTIGESGWTTGPHLHYELIKNGENLDPQIYNFASLYD